MRVKCLANSGTSLPEGYLDPQGGFGRDAIYPLVLGKEYLVYATTLRRGGVWYYLLDERGLEYPVWSPAPLFEVSDPRLSQYWVFGFHGKGARAGDGVFAFTEWAANPLDYYDKLSDGEAEAQAIFWRYRKLMELEFETQADRTVAKDLGDGWMMCPTCREAWQTSATGILMKCPNCSTTLKNPRLTTA